MVKEQGKQTKIKENRKAKVLSKLSASEKNPTQPAGNSEMKKIKSEQKSAKRGQESVEVPTRGKGHVARKSEASVATPSGSQIRKASPHKPVSTVPARDASPRSHRTVSLEDSTKCVKSKGLGKVPERTQAGDSSVLITPASPLRDTRNAAGDKVRLLLGSSL